MPDSMPRRATSRRGGSNRGCRRTSAKTCSTSPKSFLSTLIPAEPPSSPNRLDGGGATFEITIEGLGREATVPPARICDPVRLATPILSAGSSNDPVRKRADTLTSRAVAFLHHQHHEAVAAALCVSAVAAKRPARPGTSTGPPSRPGRQRRQPRGRRGTNVARAHSCAHAAHRVPSAAGAASFSSRATVRLVALKTSAATGGCRPWSRHRSVRCT